MDSCRIKAVVFDADGTLYKIRAKEAYRKMFAYLAEVSGTDAGTVESVWHGHINNIINSTDARSAEKRRREYSIGIVLGQLGIIERGKVKDATDNALGIFWKQVISDLQYDRSLAHSITLLRDKIPIAVASDEYRENLELKLNAVFGDWKKQFQFILAADDTGELKPSDKYPSFLVKRLRIKPEEILFVGDSWERDLAPASNSGMKTMLVGKDKEGTPDFYAADILGAIGQIISLVA